ncbi:MAG: mycofactocin precursor MftA [Microthrixaceae bacterium]|nr:mycofactocin precursor MftA [Microthrixaceae bacterium]MCO5320294.1 mycofactocin precursor MftA [Microthrixaceae bacterium]
MDAPSTTTTDEATGQTAVTDLGTAAEPELVEEELLVEEVSIDGMCGVY